MRELASNGKARRSPALNARYFSYKRPRTPANHRAKFRSITTRRACATLRRTQRRLRLSGLAARRCGRHTARMMKLPTLCLAVALLAAAPLSAQEKSAAPTTPSTPAPAAAPQLPPNMTVYYFCLLTKGPKSGTGTADERRTAQAAHMANIQRLADSGRLLVAGPFMDGGDWRGIFIFKAASLAEAQALVATDPLIQDGRLKAEIHPWLTMKGNIRDPEFAAAPAQQTP